MINKFSMLLTLGALASCFGQVRDQLQIHLWPGGRVPYGFAPDVTAKQRIAIVAQMARWEEALTISDPADPGRRTKTVFFEPCFTCLDARFLYIRWNLDSESGNMCRYRVDGRDVPGYNPNGMVELHMENPGEVFSVSETNTTLHELGHCLGLWHEFNREDRGLWLRAQVALNPRYPVRGQSQMPTLDNYDYDSLMHYGSRGDDDVLRWKDGAENEFSRFETERRVGQASPLAISPRDRSRLLQYYARQYNNNWQFFHSMSGPPADSGARPDPYLAPGVHAVGSPAVANHSRGNYDVLVRGSDRRIYWRAMRGSFPSSTWVSLGCCFGSDPAAISRRPGDLDVFAVGSTGKLEHKAMRALAWRDWVDVREGFPFGGLKQVGGVYAGPAVASRSPSSMDVFVVRADGLLAVASTGVDPWSAWETLGSGYVVTARPAAVALDRFNVQLAVNEKFGNLHEPVLRFPVRGDEFRMGGRTAVTAPYAAPALAARNESAVPYRVLIVNTDGRLSHRFAGGRWMDIGGIPAEGTGPGAVQDGGFGAHIVMNGGDVTACNRSCSPDSDAGVPRAPMPGGVVLQPGGLWWRNFN